MTKGARIITGGPGSIPILFQANTTSTRFLPTNRTDYSMVSEMSTYTTLRIYKPGSLSMRDVAYSNNSNREPNYYITKAPDFVLRDGNNYPIYFDTVAMGFSANGKWMVANNLNNGLWVFNTDTWEGKLFAPQLYKGADTAYIGPGSPSFAVSNDGKYAAIVNASPDGTSPSLEVYDTTTCSDQSATAKSARTYCQSKDVWNGLVNKKPVDGGIKSIAGSVVRPLNPRFRTNETLSFNAVYDYQGTDIYKAATYIATVSGAPTHQLGLLGMGDSYISGQGEFIYNPSST